MVGESRDPVVTGYDGWAVIDLREQVLVSVNERGEELLRVRSDELPVALGTLVDGNDLVLFNDQVLPRLRSGDQWQGMLRLGERDEPSSPTMMVPQLARPGGSPEYASVLFGPAPEALTHVRDPLTGLATRAQLLRRLDDAIERSRTDDSIVAVLFLDLDGLKRINDRYGHDVGDQALIDSAQRISSALPAGSLAARFGGDEFVVVREALEGQGQAEDLGREILTALNEIDDYHATSASIGVSTGRGGRFDSAELIRRADAAMYRAKAQGGAQYSVFDHEMQSAQEADEALRNSVLNALANNGFGVVAQPIFTMATGQIAAVELFIRVRNDEPYLANANRLFRLAHEYGETIDAAMLDRALSLARSWRRSFGSRAPRVHVNLSTQSMARTLFAENVEKSLVASRMPASSIAFEIDGRDMATAGERERSTLNALRDVGVPLIVDGFDGNSMSIEAVAAARPAMVKLTSDPTNQRVTTCLVRALSTLRIQACIKGIGTPASLEHAVSIGTFAGQGNALAPVENLESVEAQLQNASRIGY